MPPLSEPRVTMGQISRMFEHYRHPEWLTDFSMLRQRRILPSYQQSDGLSCRSTPRRRLALARTPRCGSVDRSQELLG